MLQGSNHLKSRELPGLSFSLFLEVCARSLQMFNAWELTVGDNNLETTLCVSEGQFPPGLMSTTA